MAFTHGVPDSAFSWAVCGTAMLAEGIFLSMSYCYSVMLPVLMSEFKQSRQLVAWVGSIAYSLIFFAAPLSVLCCQRLGYRLVALVGALTCALSLVTSSFVSSISPLFFTYGICYGVGCSLLHTSGLLVVSCYFHKRRSLATGFVAAAPCSLLLGMGPVVEYLNSNLGWRNTFRIAAALFVVILPMVGICYRPFVAERKEVSIDVEETRTEQTVEETRLDETEVRSIDSKQCSTAGLNLSNGIDKHSSVDTSSLVKTKELVRNDGENRVNDENNGTEEGNTGIKTLIGEDLDDDIVDGKYEGEHEGSNCGATHGESSIVTSKDYKNGDCETNGIEKGSYDNKGIKMLIGEDLDDIVNGKYEDEHVGTNYSATHDESSIVTSKDYKSGDCENNGVEKGSYDNKGIKMLIGENLDDIVDGKYEGGHVGCNYGATHDEPSIVTSKDDNSCDRETNAIVASRPISVYEERPTEIETKDEEKSSISKHVHYNYSGEYSILKNCLLLWSNAVFAVTVIGVTIEAFGAYMPYMHLMKHCEEIGLSPQKASTLFIYIGVSSLIGRVVSGQLCDAMRVPPLVLHQVSDVVIGGSMLLIWLSRDYMGFSIFSAVYGFGNGIYMTTFYLTLLTTTEPELRPLAFGIGEFLHSIPCAIGPALAGLLADKTGSYIPAFYMTGSVVLLGASIPCLSLCMKNNSRTPRVNRSSPRSRNAKKICKL